MGFQLPTSTGELVFFLFGSSSGYSHVFHSSQTSRREKLQKSRFQVPQNPFESPPIHETMYRSYATTYNIYIYLHTYIHIYAWFIYIDLHVHIIYTYLYTHPQKVHSLTFVAFQYKNGTLGRCSHSWKFL